MPYLNKEYTKQVRQELKKSFPEYKFSVRTVHHTSLHVDILSGPLDLMKDVDRHHESINHFHSDRIYQDYPEKKELLSQILSIMMGDQREVVYDGDYGSIPNYYVDLSIGRWDKPYIQKGK